MEYREAMLDMGLSGGLLPPLLLLVEVLLRVAVARGPWGFVEIFFSFFLFEFVV